MNLAPTVNLSCTASITSALRNQEVQQIKISQHNNSKTKIYSPSLFFFFFELPELQQTISFFEPPEGPELQKRTCMLVYNASCILRASHPG